MNSNSTHILAAIAALLALATSGRADAIEIQTGAAGACKSALPAFDGNIRTRPLAVQNEGTAAAFVSCSNSNRTADNSFRNTIVGIWVQNNNATVVNVSCTFVDGILGSAEFHPKTQLFGANSGAFIAWQAPEGDPYTPFANFSCNLPPGVGISRIAYVYPGPAS